MNEEAQTRSDTKTTPLILCMSCVPGSKVNSREGERKAKTDAGLAHRLNVLLCNLVDLRVFQRRNFRQQPNWSPPLRVLTNLRLLCSHHVSTMVRSGEVPFITRPWQSRLLNSDSGEQTHARVPLRTYHNGFFGASRWTKPWNFSLVVIAWKTLLSSSQAKPSQNPGASADSFSLVHFMRLPNLPMQQSLLYRSPSNAYGCSSTD